jgi:glutathione synthase/RimK-type ligase-like ATP-grasp enzyme
MRLRIATCTTLPEVDVDEEPLALALAAAGIDAALVAWDDPHADWETPIPTLLRSTWNYALAVNDFLAWVNRVSAVAQIWNPPAIIRTNVYKRYLLELAARGVPVIPTTLVHHGEVLDIEHGIQAQRFVIKPEVGAGSLDTRLFERGDPDAMAHLATITARGAALVQPYVSSVESYGERSMIWIDGELTHAIRKSPRFSGDDERIDGPFAIADDERRVAEAALAPYVDRILYARVDLARDDHGAPMVMELELAEPSLFFARHPPALDRFVAALIRELRRQPR